MRFPGFLRKLLFTLSLAACLTATARSQTAKAAAPELVQKDGRYALLVDGKPYLVLGGQIHNSSAWPGELPQVWESMAALHANTMEAPIYWEQMEPQEGRFDFSSVDMLVNGAREHHLHLVTLWFGTWKNGTNHYAPAWVKMDGRRFPRVIRPDGVPIDVLSPIGQNTLQADKTAFAALMRHLKQIDGDQHTVILVQVENESGNVGSVRDNSDAANRMFAEAVPADMLAATHKEKGTWKQVYGSDADELFQVYHQAKYINEIASAGKAEFGIPCYVNVWINYPAAELAQRQVDNPGIAYPSGGAVQKWIGLWRTLAPSLDMIGPDLYTGDSQQYRDALLTYRRPDNALWIPETGRSENFAKYFFYALGDGAIGFSPFGVDGPMWADAEHPDWHARNFALVAPLDRELAQLSLDGKLKTAVEEPGEATQEVDFGAWQATVAFGFPQLDGRRAPGTKDAHGAAIVAQLGPDEFLITGVDVSIVFHLPGQLPWIHSQIVTAEEGSYENGVWKPVRILNGDETDRGLRFFGKPDAVRVVMQRY